MKDENISALRQRMIEDMTIRGIGEKAQSAHIRGVKHLATFLGRSPDTATPEDLRSYQLDMTDKSISASTFNSRIVACPSSYKMGHQSGLSFGGSGSFV